MALYPHLRTGRKPGRFVIAAGIAIIFVAIFGSPRRAHALPKVDVRGKLQAVRELMDNGKAKWKAAHNVIESEVKPEIRNEIRNLKKNWATDRAIKDTPQLIPVYESALKKHGQMKSGDWQLILVGSGILAVVATATQDYTNAIIWPSLTFVGVSALTKLMRTAEGWSGALRETLAYAEENGILPHDQTPPSEVSRNGSRLPYLNRETILGLLQPFVRRR